MNIFSEFWNTSTGQSERATFVGSLYFWVFVAVIAALSYFFSGRIDLFLWSAFLLVQGAACWYGYRSCGRAHCGVTGPGFVVLGIFFLLTGLGVLPILTLGLPFDLYTSLIVAIAVMAFVYEYYVKCRTGSVFVVVTKDY